MGITYDRVPESVEAFIKAVMEKWHPELIQAGVTVQALFARVEFEAAYEPAEDLVEQARRTVIKSFMGMGSSGITRRSGFDARVNLDGYISRVNAFRDVPSAIPVISRRLRSVLIECVDAKLLVRRYKANKKALLYLDPPYLEATYRKERDYRHRYTEADHRELATELNDAASAVVISGYRSDLYDELYAHWERHEMPTTAEGGTRRKECIWTNFKTGLFSKVAP